MSTLILIVVFAAPFAWSLMAAAARGFAMDALPPDDAVEKRQLWILLMPVVLGLVLVTISRFVPVHIALPLSGGGDDGGAITATIPVRVQAAATGGVHLSQWSSAACLILWAAVALIKAARLAAAFAALSRAATTARRQLIGGRMVRVTEAAVPPFARGTGIIVLPQSLVAAFDAAALRMVIRHECEHLRRGDPDYFALLSWIDAVFWFNPVMRAQTARCRIAAEIACDTAVTNELPVSRDIYAGVLIRTLKHTAASAWAGKASCAPAVFSNANSGDYRMRIERIMQPQTVARKPKRWLYAVMATAFVPLALFQFTWAQGMPKAPKLTVSPVDAPVTSAFGRRPDTMGAGTKFHSGVDFAVPAGTPVRAPGDGKAGAVYSDAGDGKVLEIDYGGGVTTRMTHLSATSVRWGDKVTAGQVVATSGATGSVTGPHLHFEVRVHGKAVDPATMDSALAKPGA